MPDIPEPGQTHLAYLITEYAQARIKYERAKDAAKLEQERMEAAERRLFDAMDAQGLRSVRSEDYGLFLLDDKAWASVTDEAEARKWAQNEHPELITLNRMRLSVLVREALKEGTPLPPGVSFSTAAGIGWRERRTPV